MINSKSNEQVKMLASLKNKKYREKYLKYTIEGIKLVGEMIDSEGIAPSEFVVYSTELLFSSAGGKEVFDKVLKNGVKMVEVSKEVFEYISDTDTPQGILVVKDIKVFSQKEVMQKIIKASQENKKILILDKVSDAGNFGTIIRTAVSFGVNMIICIKGTIDLYNPKVVRSTMGAIQKIDIQYVTQDEYVKVVKILVNCGYEVVCTDLKAKKYLNGLDYTKNIAFVMGNESRGVSEKTKDICTDYVKIPMEECQESLNVAIATAICLYSGYTS